MTVFLLAAIPAVIITALVFALKGLALFRRHVQARFGYKFFRIWHFLAIFCGALLIFLGHWVRSASDPASRGFNGLALMALGAGLVGFLFLENCRKTNLLYGLAGTALEMAISPVLFNVSLLCLPVLILAAFGFLTAKRVYVANQDW
jgi:hypothetical protein